MGRDSTKKPMPGHGLIGVRCATMGSTSPHRWPQAAVGAALLAAALAAPSPARAQAWAQPTGRVYAKLAYGAATASNQYAFDGRVKPYADDVEGDSFFDRSLYLYSELGLTEDLTLVASLPYKRLTVVDTVYKYESGAVGDLGLGVRYGLGRWLRSVLPDGHTSAVNLRLDLPLGYTRNLIPSPGRGNLNLTATLDYGLGFWGGKAYAQAAFGTRIMTGFYGLSFAADCPLGTLGCFADEPADPGDQLLFRGELGVMPWSWLLIQALGEVALSIKAPEVGFSVAEPNPTRQSYAKLGAGLSVQPLAHLGGSLQAFVTPWGLNAPRSLDLFLGLWTQFDAF
jgi:hypothetical protein